jgi:TPR repeat protein
VAKRICLNVRTWKRILKYIFVWSSTETNLSFNFVESISIYLDRLTKVGNKNCRRAVELLKLAAEKGSADAQFFYGELKLLGIEVEKNRKAALKRFTKAHQGGSLLAVFRRLTLANDEDLDDAGVEKVRSGSDEFFEYAELIRKEKTFVSERSEARAFYRAAACTEHPARQYRYGRFLWSGAGGPTFKTENVQWCKKAAAQGHPTSILFYADSLLKGDHVEQDEVKALDLYRRASDERHIAVAAFK